MEPTFEINVDLFFYLLFIVPGFFTVWAFRKTLGRKSLFGDFEYLISSIFWGVIDYLIYEIITGKDANFIWGIVEKDIYGSMIFMAIFGAAIGLLAGWLLGSLFKSRLDKIPLFIALSFFIIVVISANLLDWLKSYSNEAFLITNFSLVIITGFYAFWNWKMAKIMSKQADLEFRPYAGFGEDIEVMVQADKGDSKKIAEETDWVQLNYAIKNLGRVPLVYKVNKTYFNKDIYGPDGPEIIIYPGQTIFYKTKIFKTKKIKVIDMKGQAGIEISYWAVDIPERMYFSSREFYISGGTSYTILRDKAGVLR